MKRTFKSCLFALLAGALAVAAFAQSTTATIRGKVTNEQGAALADAEVNAVGTASGFVKTVNAGPDGIVPARRPHAGRVQHRRRRRPASSRARRR